MKGKSNIGYKVLFFIALVAIIASAGARGFKPFFAYYLPEVDSPTDNTGEKKEPISLHFPIYDKTGDPYTDYNRPRSMDLNDPKNVKKSFDFDADSNRYNYTERVGGDFLRNPTYLTLDEYLKYRGKMDEDAYWQRRLDGLMQFNKTPELPQMYKDGLFDRIFGSNTIQVKPQGNVDVTFGGNWQNIKNPLLTQRAQKYGVFDFDMQMNINLLATVGDKLKLNISNNTKATFDYQNVQKLDYSGKEDEMLKKIEAGNVSFPLKSSLISGVQSLFGLKAQLQFGKLWVTGVVSQQKSQRKSLTIQGGSQAQQIAIKADNYEENKNFLLGQYFHTHYNTALKNFPELNSGVTINRVQVWVTNKTGAVTGVRDVLCFSDLGEAQPYKQSLTDINSTVRNGLPDNHANHLYDLLLRSPTGRQQSNALNALIPIGLTQGVDFEHTTARQLTNSEFTFNPRLGFIMLNTQMSPDDVLGVAYRYTYRGKVYQVGEFAEDLPPDTSNPKIIFLKLLKGTSARPALPIWKLMMKNIYALGGFGVSKENFTLNILYQDPGGGEKRYMPQGKNEGVPFISLLNLDRLNSQGEASPDGIFDFVEGTTINTQQGKIIFPLLEPFGSDLAPSVEGATPAATTNLHKKYVFQVLYDSTKTVAIQSQENDRYILRGTYKSTSGADIFLGGFNIPPGSVSVSAGGTKLVENQDYSIDYALGKIKIINTGILSSGVPINIQYEDNATFGFQQQNFIGTRFDYYMNKKLTLGGTLMRLSERPFTQQVTFGEDPIKNTVLGLDANYQTEIPALTRALDKLPIYSTTAPSFGNLNLEVAGIMPSHPKQIDALDPEGAVYIDNFEGANSSFDLKFPSISWSLASTPSGAVNKNGQTLFPESAEDDQLSNGKNRAKLAWYTIEPTLVDPGVNAPQYVKYDPNQHYIRMVQQKDVFPSMSNLPLQSILTTFDMAFFPNQRGPYNFDANPATLNPDGTFNNPENRWGGVQRPIDNTDFEASNVEYIHFWLMDPFLNNTNSKGGSLYINLGSVSEDVLKDSRLFFENGIPSPFDKSKLDTTIWGYVPKFAQQITRAFDNEQSSRELQDVGYDGLPDQSTNPDQLTEQTKFGAFLKQVKLIVTPQVYSNILADPANDDYHFYRGADYDAANHDTGAYVIQRYKKFNNPDGNSPITAANASFPTSATTLPESEDINRDNTLNEAESYFQYRVDLKPNMVSGSNYIITKTVNNVSLPNGTTNVPETWYEFKIPIHNFDHVVGGIGDFRSIRFIRMFLSGFQDSSFVRFATLELTRNQWRTYRYSLNSPGENEPQSNKGLTDFSVATVNVEQNSPKYVLPPGVSRQLTTVSTTQTALQNEQSLALKVCALQDGDARAVFKEVNVDMRQFTYLRMFMHAESMPNAPEVKNADVSAFIRIGSDFTNNYYEYRMPLTVTNYGGATTLPDYLTWPGSNEVDIVLQDLVEAKKKRDASNWPNFQPYSTIDSKGNTIVVLGNPNIGSAKNIMLGLLNPKKTNQTAGDDGLPKCIEVWFDEMRMAGTNDHPGYAAAGKVSFQLADLGNLNASGSMHTAGYGNIDQKIQQRSQDNYYQFNTSTNLSLGKLLPHDWGVQLPFYVGYTQNVSTPKYDPYNQDVVLNDEINSTKSARLRDSIKNVAQDFTSITSFNFTNVRITGNPSAPIKKFKMPWSIKNFDFNFSYNNQFKRNPTIAADNLITEKLGIGYNYSVKSKPIEPFKKLIKSKSKWFALIKDININPLPSSFTMRNDLNRVNEITQVRNIEGAHGYSIPPTYYKNFTWNRSYTLRWELMKSISFDYNATNISRIDEPYGLINTKQKRDSLFDRIVGLGHTTSFTQTFNGSYNVPLSKLPLTDWITLRLGYTAKYTWTGADPVAYNLGNLISNTQTKTLAGEFNLKQLYDKSKWLRALNNKPVSNKNSSSGTKPKSDSSANGGGGNNENNKGVKDLRQLPGKNSLAPGAGSNLTPGIGGAAGGLASGNTTAKGNGPGANGLTGGGSVGGGNTGAGNTGGGNTGGGNSGGGNSGGGNSGNGNAGGNNGIGNTGGGNGGTAASGKTKGPAKVDISGNTGGGNTGGGNAGGGNAGGGNSGGGNSGGDNSGAVDPATLPYHGVNTTNMTDDQLDSLVQVQNEQDRAKAAAEKAKRKAAKKAARKARRAKPPVLTPAESAIGHVLTMVNRVTINYTETGGTVLPGWMDSTRFMGINTSSFAPGYNFVYGYQPDYSWLAAQASADRLTRDSLFNAQFQQTYSSNLNATMAVSPTKDFRLDLNLTQTFSKSHSELYADTGGVGGPKGLGEFHHFNPYETGSFSITYITMSSLFSNTGVGSAIYNQFLDNRLIISHRLGISNPYTNGLVDPSDPKYLKGYTSFSQDVLIPSFIAAYSGKSASSVPMIDYNHQSVSDNPFKYFFPMPNWKLNYSGLSKIPAMAKYFKTLTITSGYTGTMSMNGFSSSLLFGDLYGLGFPSFIDPNSHNYVPFFQMPNVTITQALNPLIGFDIAFLNNLTGRFEIRKSKMDALSLIDYQISENASTEYVIGAGFRKKGVKLPFKVMGVKKLKNELIGKLDISLRDDKSTNTFLSNNIGIVSRGQVVLRISPSLDYSVNQKLTLHFFFDRQQTIPYVSNSYPTTTTKGGLMLRFIFAQ